MTCTRDVRRQAEILETWAEMRHADMQTVRLATEGGGRRLQTPFSNPFPIVSISIYMDTIYMELLCDIAILGGRDGGGVE